MTERYRVQVLMDGAEGYWRLGESSGTAILDQTGHAHAGSYVSTPTLGIAGAIADGDTAVAFASGEYGTIPDHAALRPAIFSVSVWFRRAAVPGDYRTLLFKTSGDSWGNGWGFFISSGSDKMTFFVNSWTTPVVSATFSLDVWHQAVGTFDGDTARLYVDGVEVGTPVAGITFVPSTAPLLIGADIPASAFFWDGDIDEVAFFPTALTAAQVAAQYASAAVTGLVGASAPVPTLNLGVSYLAAVLANSPVGYWPLRERIGAVCHDDATYSTSDPQYDGTYVNAPLLGDAPGPLPEGGTCVRFAASATQYVDVGDIAALRPIAAVSLEAWVKIDAQQSTIRVIAGYAGVGDVGYLMLVNTSNVIRFRVGNLSFTVSVGTYELQPDEWVHVVGTYLRDGDVKIYVNGTLNDSAPQTDYISYVGLTGFQIANGWDDAIAHVAVYEGAMGAAMVAAHYAASQWTDVTEDLDADTGWRVQRGLRGNTPTHRLANPGTFYFALKNHAGNALGLQGAYSPHHTNARAGFTHGIPVQLILTYDGTPREVFRGKIQDITPEPGRYGPAQLTHCTAYDFVYQLYQADVREIPALASVADDDVLRYILDAMPSAEQPAGVDFDLGPDTYTYPLHGMGAGLTAAQAMTEVLTTSRGKLFTTGDGTLRYLSRHAQISQASQFAFTDAHLQPGLLVPSTRRNVYTLIRGTYYPKNIGSVTTAVLWSLEVPQEVADAETLEWWVTYRDPANPDDEAMGADFQTPVSGTDWTANTQQDGGGTDVTASVVFEVFPWATTARIRATNNSGAAAFLIAPTQIRGRLILARTQQVVQAKSTVQLDGARALTVDLSLEGDGNQAQGKVDFVLHEYESLENQVDWIPFLPQKSDALMQQALDREVGDLITITETLTGIDAPLVITTIALGMRAGTLVQAAFGTGPKVVGQASYYDDPVSGLIDDTAVLSYA
jgi:hypothetical protein